jgi:Cysteine-rich CPCC
VTKSVEPVVAMRCLCCGYKTLSLPGGLELCQVCWWQDDGQDDSDSYVVRGTVNGDLSLAEARLNFQLYGAAHLRFKSHVRAPRAEEL